MGWSAREVGVLRCGRAYPIEVSTIRSRVRPLIHVLGMLRDAVNDCNRGAPPKAGSNSPVRPPREAATATAAPSSGGGPELKNVVFLRRNPRNDLTLPHKQPQFALILSSELRLRRVARKSTRRR
jgi:hypothetical protein